MLRDPLETKYQKLIFQFLLLKKFFSVFVFRFPRLFFFRFSISKILKILEGVGEYRVLGFKGFWDMRDIKRLWGLGWTSSDIPLNLSTLGLDSRSRVESRSRGWFSVSVSTLESRLFLTLEHHYWTEIQVALKLLKWCKK